MTLRIVFIRHGQTRLNVEKRFQGQSDIPLNQVGLAQAAAMADALAGGVASVGTLSDGDSVGGGKQSWQAIFSSDLSRAFETANFLASRVGLEVQVDQRLRERYFGDFEGKNEAELRESGLAEAFDLWRNTGDASVAGVELRAAVGQRVVAAVADIRQKYPAGNVAVVAHGSTITQGVVALLGLDPSVWAGLRGLDNCHWAVLETTRREPGWRLSGYNLSA